MAKIKSFGLSVYVDGDAVGGLTDASVSGVDVNNIDLTAHDSAGGWKEFVSGLLDGGTLDLTGKFDIADAGQGTIQSSVGDSVPCYVIHSDGSGMAFNAIVGGYASSNPLDDAVEFTSSVKITGPISTVYPTMTISGTLSPDITGTCTPAGFALGAPYWTSNGLPLEENTGVGAFTLIVKTGEGSGTFSVIAYDTDGLTETFNAVSGDATTPDGATYGAPSVGSGIPTITGS